MITFDRITDSLYIGTCPRTPKDADLLRKTGITAVFNLQTDDDFITHEIDWPTLKNAYESNGIALIRLEIVDFDKKDLVALLPDAANLLRGALADGQHVYLHCTAGHERSPATAVAYFAWHQGWGLEKALSFVKAARKCEPYEDALQEADRLFKRSQS